MNQKNVIQDDDLETYHELNYKLQYSTPYFTSSLCSTTDPLSTEIVTLISILTEGINDCFSLNDEVTFASCVISSSLTTGKWSDKTPETQIVTVILNKQFLPSSKSIRRKTVGEISDW